jgi:hypothetical protein
MEGERSRAEKYPSSRFGKSIWVEVPGNKPLERDFERDNPFWRLARRGRTVSILARNFFHMLYCCWFTWVRWSLKDLMGIIEMINTLLEAA